MCLDTLHYNIEIGDEVKKGWRFDFYCLNFQCVLREEKMTLINSN